MQENKLKLKPGDIKPSIVGDTRWLTPEEITKSTITYINSLEQNKTIDEYTKKEFVKLIEGTMKKTKDSIPFAYFMHFV